MGKTRVEIRGEDFWINGKPTYPGREWNGGRIEGLLLNSRMVQATFDDLNPQTRDLWVYPDTGVWDPERNTNEFVEALPEYHHQGLVAVTLNLQGGSPQSYSRSQPWINTAFTVDGDLRPAYMARLGRILGRMDELGMVAILGLFYFGQDEQLRDEAAICRGVDNVVGWLLDGGHTNVLVEINNEYEVPAYEHEILQPNRVHELLERVKAATRDGRRLLVSASGYKIPPENVVRASDFILIHGNGVGPPFNLFRSIDDMIEQTQAVQGYRPMPIVFNEDDHFAFERPDNNFVAAVRRHASWGYFDAGPGAGGKGARSDYVEGYQNVPVNWTINTDRKRGFFGLVRAMTGEQS